MQTLKIFPTEKLAKGLRAMNGRFCLPFDVSGASKYAFMNVGIWSDLYKALGGVITEHTPHNALKREVLKKVDKYLKDEFFGKNKSFYWLAEDQESPHDAYIRTQLEEKHIPISS